MNEQLTDKAESVQCILDILRVLRDAASDQVDWFAKQPYTSEVLTTMVQDTVQDVQTMLTVLDDYLRRAKAEQDEIVSMLVDIRRLNQTKEATA